TTRTYNIRFFSNDSLSLLATSATITVQIGGATTVSVSTAVVRSGATFTASVANGPANARDWIALYQAGAANASYSDWKYLNGLQTPPTTGVGSATVTFTAPPASGSYNVRVFSNDTYTLIASSPNFVVDGT